MSEMKNEKNETKNENAGASQSAGPLIGNNLSFAAAESYKKLRVNLLFSLPENGEHCKVVGVTSAIRGDGKTTTSINLACALADTGQKVLLIDGDMRLPGVSRKTRISGAPGLSNILTNNKFDNLPFQKTVFNDSLLLLSGGDIPPNPSELLGGRAMKRLIRELKEEFDFIILDLPPITVVSDALVVTTLCTGFLLVVRQGYTGSREVETAVNYLKHCRARILGYVLNDTTRVEGSYSKAYRSGYYNGDYRTYGYNARSTAESGMKKKKSEAAGKQKSDDTQKRDE